MRKILLGAIAFIFKSLWVFLLVVVGMLMVVISMLFISKWSSSEAAAWTQAVGSIVGIFTAVAIGVHQTKSSSRQRSIEARNKRKSCLAVVEFAAQQGQACSNYLESLRNLRPYVSAWEDKLSSVNKFSLDALAAIPMHELGDHLAVLAYSEIYTNLASIREESVGLVADIKAQKHENSDRINAIHLAAKGLRGDLLNFQMYYKVSPAS